MGTRSEDVGAPLSKRLLAAAADRTGALGIDLALRGTGVVLAVNYHPTPARLVSGLKEHFAFYRERFQCLGEQEVLAFLSGRLRLRKPGVILSFDDGLREHAEVAAPLLETFGLRGWFMVPGGFLDEPQGLQNDYFVERVRRQPAGTASASAMTWAMARSLASRGHVLGCHTWSHRPLGGAVSADMLEAEVDRAKDCMEERLGSKVRTFAWVRGRVGDYSAAAYRAVERRFDVGLMSMGRALRRGGNALAIHRFNVEASFSLPLVRFQVSRFNEAAFAARRRLVEATIRGG